MREILFRGKRIDGQWIEGDLFHYENGKTAIFEEKLTDYGYEATELHKRTLVDPETVCQYTGLIDKNGKKIFEGDILNVIYSDSVGECHHVEGCVVDDLRKTEVIGWLDYANELDVIGNIFDNKDLLTD